MKELYFIGVAQALFFISLLLFRKKKEAKDWFLLSFILCLGLELLLFYGFKVKWHHSFPFIFFLDIIFWTWLGPLLFLYIEFTIKPKSKLKPLYLLHLLPFFFC